MTAKGLRAHFDPKVSLAKNCFDHGISEEVQVNFGIMVMTVLEHGVTSLQLANLLEIHAESIYSGQANRMLIRFGKEPVPVAEPELRKETKP